MDQTTKYSPWFFALFVLTLLCAVACRHREAVPALVPERWEDVEAGAWETTVHMMMWQGDPMINRYMAEYVAPLLQERYGIALRIAPGQGNEVVKVLMAEQEAGVRQGKIDLCWINGETYFQLRQINGLYGPFVDQLPHARYLNLDHPFIGLDFQQPIDGYECPWGNVQMALIYDTLRTPDPPQTLQALEAYLQAHPGTFTIPYEFTGITLLKSWMAALGGGKEALNGPFDEARYRVLSEELWTFIRRIKPYLWRQGKTFPETLSAMHQMFANGELHFTMSNNDGEVDNKILQGVFPPTSRAFVPQTGTIQNAHYLGIPARAANKLGAMVVINALLSPEAQWEKMKPAVWGDGTVLDMGKLPAEWVSRFEHVPERRHAPPRRLIEPYAIQEPDPEYMIRLYRDFRKQVIEHE
jgi:putative spermidine/putrescine transport system substrate-binding protein